MVQPRSRWLYAHASCGVPVEERATKISHLVSVCIRERHHCGGTFTHEYQRHGTTCLFAALHVGKGNVVAECHPRHQEFLRFLRRIETEFPPPRDLHLILDNYSIHGHERVRAWLRKRPRFVLHFIPTSSSWLNLVERWFAELEQKTVRRGAFRSVDELHTAIDEFLAA